MMDSTWVATASALSGVLLGGAISWLHDLSRWRRDTAIRWDAERRHAYSRFLTASEAYETVVYGLSQSSVARSSPWDVNRGEIDPAFIELRQSMSDVRLVASFPVAFAAVELCLLLVPAFGELRPGHDYGPYGWAAVDWSGDAPGDALVEARNDFVGKARRELGLADVGAVSGIPAHLD